MPKPLVWVKIKTSEPGPSARMGHTLVEMDKDLYIMYGGLDAQSRLEGNIVPNGHVFTLRVSQKGEYVWAQTDCEGDEIPLPRTNHAACKIGKNEMFVFGGYYTSKKRFNDVHILKIVLGTPLSFFFSRLLPRERFSASRRRGAITVTFSVANCRQEIPVDPARQPKARQGHSQEYRVQDRRT
jgi:Galactose oxidase, central domain